MERTPAIKLIHGADAAQPMDQGGLHAGPAEVFKTLVMPGHIFARSVMCLAGIVIIIAGLKMAAGIFNILFFSWILAQTFSPLLSLLMRRKFSTTASLAITITLMSVLGICITSVMGFSISSLLTNLPAYQRSLQDMHSHITSFLASKGVVISSGMQSYDIISLDKYIPLIKQGLAYLGTFVGNIVLIVVIAAILLLEFAAEERRGEKKGNALFELVKKSSKDVKHYVAIIGGTGLVQALMYVVLLLVLDVNHAFVSGMIFFCMNFVPAVGLVFSMALPVLVGYIEHGPVTALMVIVGYVGINCLFDWVIKPSFFNVHLDISLFMILTSLIFWAWVLGPAGLLLAVPLTLFIKTLLLELAKQPAHGKGPAEVSF